jgi:hypothetical protein
MRFGVALDLWAKENLAAVNTSWACLASTLPPALRVDCHEGGTYDHKAVGGDSGPAWKHTADDRSRNDDDAHR